MVRAKTNSPKDNYSGLNFEAHLWAAAEQAVPAPNCEESEYNSARPEGLVLGLIFLKYISDAYEEKREQLLLSFSDPKGDWFIKDEEQRPEAADERDFSLSASTGERAGVRCRVLFSPANNANYAWIQHFLHRLSTVGMAGFVMANGSMSTQTSNEGEIRKAIIEADLVDCIVALPGQLFFTTQIPVCLWFLARDKKNSKRRDRRGETLFIDARKMGVLTDRVHRELTAEETSKISDTYHAWRSKTAKPAYADEPGFCKSVKLEEIRAHDFVLTPGRYVGAAELEDDGEPFEQKMKRLTATLDEQFADSAKLEKAIRQNLKSLSHA